MAIKLNYKDFPKLEVIEIEGVLYNYSIFKTLGLASSHKDTVFFITRTGEDIFTIKREKVPPQGTEK